MKYKLISAMALTLGCVANANAYEKIFEWNDPVQGNYPAECSAAKTYGTGGGGPGYIYYYDEFTVNCPLHPTLKVGVEKSWSSSQGNRCDRVTVNNSAYTTSWNDCNNWRVYKK
ncbi:hypothetical protein KO528_06440 [Saccharophagus degradans]|uniref:hypothetical protein n=1 Tax=Saccharophagus degradans TaxID=86304 RepID=UPI001C0A5880|nr:hypothetical protein [Saccharophagus degradans]MBU2984979.1 hypothetical protein [Saccharophagus degradans]